MSSRAGNILSVRRLIRSRWQAWLDRRLPPQNRIVLNQKKIFILPSWMGIGYLFTTLLLFLAGVNYENSLILNFSFFLGSLFVVSILQCHRIAPISKFGLGIEKEKPRRSEAKSGYHGAIGLNGIEKPGSWLRLVRNCKYQF